MANVTVSVTDTALNVSTTISNITVTDSDGGQTFNVSTIASNIAVTAPVTNVIVGPSTGVSNAEIRSALGNVFPILYDANTGIISIDEDAINIANAIVNGNITLKKFQETLYDNGNVSGAVSINLSNGSIHKLRLNGNVTGITVNNTSIGSGFVILLKQDEFGGRTLVGANSWPNWDFIGDQATLSGNPDDTDVLSVIYDGTSYIASLVNDSSVLVDITAQNITANGNIVGNNLSISNDITAEDIFCLTLTSQNNIVSNANITGQNVIANSAVSATSITASGTVSGGNLSTTGNVATVGVVATGNVATVGLVASGNVSGNYFLGNGRFLTGIVNPAIVQSPLNYNSATQTLSLAANGNVVTRYLTVDSGISPNEGSPANLLGYAAAIYADAATSGKALYVSGNSLFIQDEDTSNISFVIRGNRGIGTVDPLSVFSNNTVTGVQIDGNLSVGAFNNTAISTSIFSQGPILSNSNITGQNITANANVTAQFFLGNGSLLTGISGLTNAQVVSYIATQPLTVGGNLTVNGNINATGNINVQNVEDLYVRDQTIVMNANAASPANVQIVSNRPGSANTEIKWNEQTDRWTFTNDGTTYYNLATSTTDVAEGTNLYYSNTRVNAFIQDNITTTDIDEGTNLYYTTDRANTAIDTRVNKAFVEGLGVSYTSLSDKPSIPTHTSNLTNDSGFITATTANVVSVNGETGVVVLDTGDIAENGNLYYTTDRANTAIGAYQGAINTAGNITTSANVQGQYILGNGAFLTGITGTGSYGDANVNALLSGGTLTSNIATTGNIVGAYLYGDGSNITGLSGSGTVTQVNTSENLTGGPITTTGTIGLANALANVNSVTAQANVNFAVNTDKKLILSQQYKNTTTYSGNISGQGYAVIGGRLDSTAIAHTGANALPSLYVTGGFSTANSNVLSNVTVEWTGNAAPASVSDIKPYYAFATLLGQSGQYPFPQGTYVTSVDAANSQVFMSQNETTGVNGGIFNSSFSPGAQDPETGLLISFVSAEDAGGSGANVIVQTTVHNSGLYAYPESGWDPSYFTYAIDTASDYNMSGTTDLAWAKTSIEGNKSILNSPYGLTLGSRTDPSQMGTDDTRPRFGLNVLWDGLTTLEEFGNATPTTGILLRQYNDPAIFTRQDKARSGPSIVFTASEGIGSQPYRDTYPRNNTELGKILWATPTNVNPSPSFNVPQVWINCLTGQDALVGGTGGSKVSGAGVYFANSPNVLTTQRGLYFANTKGNTLIAGGAFGTSKINFGPMNLTDPTGNSASMYVAAEGNKFAQIGYANTSTARGSEVAVTNGRRYGSPAVGDLQFTFNRIDNTNGTVPSAVSIFDNDWNYVPRATYGDPADMIVTEQTLILPTGTAVVPSGFTGDYGNAVNGNTYYVQNLGSGGGARFYFLYTDSALTTPLDLGIAGGDYGAGIYTYTLAAGVSGVTNKTWNIALEEQSNDLKFKANGTTVATITDAGNVTATTFIGNVSGTTGAFSGTVTATEFVGGGSDLTDVRAKTVELTVKNISGANIAKGYPLHVVSATAGGTPEVVLADAGNAALMPAHYIAGEDLAIDAEGRGIVSGEIRGINTSSFIIGEVIFVAVGGGYSNVAPSGESNIIQNLGIVSRVDAVNGGGEIFGAGRGAATPALNTGNVFIGGAGNVTVTKPLTTAITDANVKLKQFAETVVSLGNVSGDISSNIDVANGTIYQLTATGGITINSLANAAAGTSATIIVTQDGTGGHALTSSMLFAGAGKTLSTAPNSIDIISVFYDGSTYYATLSKGYA